MNLGLVVAAHNSMPDFDRLALSLHGQNYTDWRGYVADIDSDDRLSRITHQLSQTWDCTILSNRFDYYDIKNYEEFDTVIKAAMQAPPFNHVIGFVRPAYRFDPKALELVMDSFNGGYEVITAPLVRYYDKWGEQTTVYFIRRKFLENGKVTVGENEFFLDFPESPKKERALKNPIGFDFTPMEAK